MDRRVIHRGGMLGNPSCGQLPPTQPSPLKVGGLWSALVRPTSFASPPTFRGEGGRGAATENPLLSLFQLLQSPSGIARAVGAGRVVSAATWAAACRPEGEPGHRVGSSGSRLFHRGPDGSPCDPAALGGSLIHPIREASLSPGPGCSTCGSYGFGLRPKGLVPMTTERFRMKTGGDMRAIFIV
jgi:hypothetical protein